MGLPINFNGNPDLEPTGYDNTLVALSPARRQTADLRRSSDPTGDRFIGDLDLHYDAEPLLLSHAGCPGPLGRVPNWTWTAER